MTDIEQKMQTLLDEARIGIPLASEWAIQRVALRRAIEQHEAFRQEVSDAVEAAATVGSSWVKECLARFIIAKPDPLVEVLDEALWEVSNVKLTDRELRAVSLRLNAKRGGKIVWGEG